MRSVECSEILIVHHYHVDKNYLIRQQASSYRKETVLKQRYQNGHLTGKNAALLRVKTRVIQVITRHHTGETRSSYRQITVIIQVA